VAHAGLSPEATEDGQARAVSALAIAGFLAPEAEATALLAASHHGVGSIDALLARRLEGEPLAWITGSVTFCGLRIRVDPGVFVPRPHTEALVRRAVELLPSDGTAVDLCTGSGAVAAVLGSAHPDAIVVGTDVDPLAVACAQRNGVRVFEGDLDAPLPPEFRGRVDLLTAVVPYVPTEELPFLPRAVRAHEPRHALDGGPRGTTELVRAAEAAPRWLRPGATALLELGGDQAAEMTATLRDLGFTHIRIHADEDGQDRAIEGRLGPLPPAAIGEG
jgi:release factor glutamine methyltransferase